MSKNRKTNKKLTQKVNNELIDDNEMKKTFNHVVDYIMAKRVGLNGKVEYLVKWYGWHHRTATWEPVSNFASPQIADIFETGLRQQMGTKEVSPTLNASDKSKDSKIGAKTKKKCLEPMATKFCEELRKKSVKGKRKTVAIKAMSAQKLFDVEVSKIERVIRKYEPLVGASKRKSSRMSCPSSPSKTKISPKEVVLSQRSKRYKMRDILKTSPLSAEKNKCLDENSIKSSPKTKQKSNKRRKMKVNNDCNKMSNCSPNVCSDNLCEELSSPSKRFINKVKNRFDAEEYQTFLNEIIQFQTYNLEFKRLLNNNEELIRDFFNILLLDSEKPLKKDVNHLATEEEILKSIQNWILKVENLLKEEQRIEFYNFIENKDKDDILKASPDYLWLNVKKLLSKHNDLSEEFKNFMPILCSKLHSLYSSE